MRTFIFHARIPSTVPARRTPRSRLPRRDALIVDASLARLCFPAQAATSFVNDSLLTTVCIQFRPGQVAAAVVYLSYLFVGLPRVDTTLLETDVTIVAGETDVQLASLFGAFF